jgi:hypothetical protein
LLRGQAGVSASTAHSIAGGFRRIRSGVSVNGMARRVMGPRSFGWYGPSSMSLPVRARSVGLLPLALLSPVLGCSSSSSPAPSLSGGVYVPASTEAASAYQELGFYDTTRYFLWKSGCLGNSDACLEQGTYVVGPSELTLRDSATSKLTTLGLSGVVSSPETMSDALHVLGGATAGADAGQSLTSSAGVSLVADGGTVLSRVVSFLLSGQTFLVWGPSGLTGNFSSPVCETFPDGTYQLRSYSFGAKGVASAHWDRYSDPSCSADSKLMSIVLSGSASVDGLSGDSVGAANITVSIAHKTVLPTAAGIPVLQKECSGFTGSAGMEQSIDTGCGALLQQTNDCPAEYDLISLRPTGLVFGDRSHPLCSASTRPTSLSEWSVVPGSGYVPPQTAP